MSSYPSWGMLPNINFREPGYEDPIAVEHAMGRRPEYVYLASDLFTDVSICELPLTAVTFNWAINEPGKLVGTMNVSTFANKNTYFKATDPCKTVVYVIRDGVPIWGGIIWKRDFDSEKREMRIEAETWDSYMKKRMIVDDISIQYDPSGIPAIPDTEPGKGMEQIEIFRQLWKFMSRSANSDIGVVLGNQTSGIRRGFQVNKSDYTTFIEAVKKLASSSQEDDKNEKQFEGFEWYATVGLRADGRSIERRIEFAYPKFGRSWEETGIVWEYPGNILKYTVTSNSEGAATVMWVTGEGEGENQTYVGRTNTEAHDAGYPRMDMKEPHPNVAHSDLLLTYAGKYLYARQPPVNEITVEPHPIIPSHLGQYFIGDKIRFLINDDLFGYADIEERDLVGRIINLSVTPNDEGLEQIKPEFKIDSRYLKIIDTDDVSNDMLGEDWKGLTIMPPDDFPWVPTEPNSTTSVRKRRGYSTSRGMRALERARLTGEDPWGKSIP